MSAIEAKPDALRHVHRFAMQASRMLRHIFAQYIR
jgi:hypothetical protein